jgi:preprotein translocase subunit SecA
MSTQAQTNISLRMAQGTKEQFDYLFEESGANSKGEFFSMLLDRYENPPKSKPTEKVVEVEKPVEVVKTVEVEKLVEVEKALEANQLLLTLSEAELFALRETVLSFSDFAERQNEVIDSFRRNTWIGSSRQYSPEIEQLWRHFEPISETTTDEEREKIVKSNILSCLFNAFLLLLFIPERSEEINESLVTPKIIREYIKAQADQTPVKQ